MTEYKIIVDLVPAAQMKLNQWRHKYLLYIIEMSAFVDKDGVVRVIILLERTEKKGE